MPARVRAESRGVFYDELLTHRTNFQGDRAAERKSTRVTKGDDFLFLGEILGSKTKNFRHLLLQANRGKLTMGQVDVQG
jgi:hypothetical protein